MNTAIKEFHKSAVYIEALTILIIPIFLSTEHAMEWGSNLNAKQHFTLITVQSALSDTARVESDLQRKLDLAMQSQLMREASQAFVAQS